MSDVALSLALLSAIVLIGAYREYTAANHRDALCLASFGGAGTLAGLGLWWA
jgi:fermentation-respiration switch protein FrsA (DUF1100 family)